MTSGRTSVRSGGRPSLRPAALATIAGTALGALVALGMPSAGAAPPFGKVSVVQLPKAHAVRHAVLADVDLDRRLDLIVSARRSGRREARLLRVHLRRDGEAAFAGEPDAELELPGDVVAFGAADLDAEPGSEVALFTATEVWVWRPRAPEERRLARIAAGDFLWQLPEPREAFPWDGSFHDLDGDGRTDLVLPEPLGYRILLQRRPKDAGAPTSFTERSSLRVPQDAAGPDDEPLGARRMRARAERKRMRAALQFGESDAATELLSVTESVPAPQVADFDGDGRLDVLAQTPHELHVWRQSPAGAFADAPDASYPLPVVADRKRRLDVSYSAHVARVDADARADVVVFGGSPDASDVRTQVLVWTQSEGTAASPLFGARGTPRQVLVIAGFAGWPRFTDVDGDGLADLVTGAVRLDALDALAAAATGTLDAELYVYRNLGGRFSDAPAFRMAIDVRADGMRRGRESYLGRFVADVTGDGVRDLLLRDDPERLRLLLVRRSGDTYAAVERPLFETALQEDARVQTATSPDGRTEVVIAEDTQVRHVRFR